MAAMEMPMLKRIPMLGLIVAGAALVTPVNVFAQTKAAPEIREILARQFKEISDKLITMAEDFPEAKFDFKATPEVRSFADNLRHVAFWNQYVTGQLKGVKVDPSVNELPKSDYPTKAKIVAVLKSSTADALAALNEQPATPPAPVVRLLDSFTEHTGEHYGQLVVYYRLNGIVPPESRPKK